MAGESVRRNFTPFLISVGGPPPNPGRDRVAVGGDAGGFVNALTAEGIYYAMVSGDLGAGHRRDRRGDRRQPARATTPARVE
jgi:hypothetical protein